MKMIEQLYELNDEGLPVLSPLARNIKVFRNIIEEDKGGVKGDADGRKKLTAMKQIAFVIISATKTLFMDYHPTQRPIAIKRSLDLPDDFEITASMQLAIDKMSEHEITVTEKMFNMLTRVQHQQISLLEALSIKTENQIDKLNALLKDVDVNGVMTDVELANYVSISNSLKDGFKTVSEMTVSLAKQLNEVEEYRKRFVLEQKELKKNGKVISSNAFEDREVKDRRASRITIQA